MLDELLKYTQKADNIMLNAYEVIGFNIPEANTLFGHVLSAQHIWAYRIMGHAPKYAVWATFLPQEMKDISAANFALLFQILEEGELEKIITYGNSSGATFSNTVSEIMLHLCNHGTYHRGQLAKLLRRAGHIPPVTDYIILKRENL